MQIIISPSGMVATSISVLSIAVLNEAIKRLRINLSEVIVRFLNKCPKTTSEESIRDNHTNENTPLIQQSNNRNRLLTILTFLNSKIFKNSQTLLVIAVYVIKIDILKIQAHHNIKNNTRDPFLKISVNNLLQFSQDHGFFGPKLPRVTEYRKTKAPYNIFKNMLRIGIYSMLA